MTRRSRAPKALVVDDSLTVRIDLIEGLGAAGFEATGCASLGEARAAGRFDIAILDVRLDDGSGVDLLAEIREKEDEHTHTPVMMLSSKEEVADRVQALRTGADEYAGKPYVMSYVVTRALELTENARSRPPVYDDRTVLIIDDSVTFREALREALEDADYDVVGCDSGEEALQRLTRIRPSLVIVDGHLPGMDGTTVVRRLRLDAAFRHTPVLMITGSDLVGEIGAFEARVDGYLSKRTPPEEVVARVAALLSTTSMAKLGAVPSALGAKKVLVVGRGPSRLDAMLRGAGYEIINASSVDEALPLLDVAAPDAIVLDGADGADPYKCRVVREHTHACAVVAVLNDASSALAVECLSAGADEVVASDIDAALLLARLRAQLRRKQSEEEGTRERNQELARELMLAEARAARELAETRSKHLAELERMNAELAVANTELEAFSYSVSHDLRAPLRAISGFSRALEEDQGHLLDDIGRQHLARVHSSTKRMAELIDDLLTISRVGRAELKAMPVDLSALARDVADECARRAGDRKVEVTVLPGLAVNGDPSLLRAVLENVLGNAWKFTSKREDAKIEVGQQVAGNDERPYFVRDNGVGFDMAHVERLFRPFQRLHSNKEFEGTGVGLATVRRIVVRHGGRVWLESEPGVGTTVYFTLL